MKKLEKEGLTAERETISRLLVDVSDNDPLGAMSLSSRLAEVNSELEALSQAQSTLGSVALMFAGTPVRGSRSIGAEFASKILGVYQDLISKRIATEENGRLGARGPVRFQTESALAITDVIRGSVGFVLQEDSRNQSLDDTAVKKAIEEVSKVIEGTSSENEADFEDAVETLDPRVLASLSNFFSTLDDHEATIRIVADERDSALDRNAIRRAKERVDATSIEEKEDETIVGIILGIVTHFRRFDMRLSDGTTIWGSVAAPATQRYLQLIADPINSPVGKRWRVKMKVREVKERNKETKILYTLLGLLEELPITSELP